MLDYLKRLFGFSKPQQAEQVVEVPYKVETPVVHKPDLTAQGYKTIPVEQAKKPETKKVTAAKKPVAKAPAKKVATKKPAKSKAKKTS